MKIDLFALDIAESAYKYLLGTVSPPDGHEPGDQQAVHDALDGFWAEWREAVPEPDSDYEFILWLVEEKGWIEEDSNIQHTF